MGLKERKALYSEAKEKRMPRNPLWIHAVSVGEVQSAWPLLDALAKDGWTDGTVLSTATSTGRDMAFRLAEGLFDEHIYYPWDTPRIVKRALDVLHPRGYIVLETEIWPTMLSELEKRKIPSFLVNGRFSDRTARNIRARPSFWRRVYDCFSLFLVRCRNDRELLLDVGIEDRKIRVTGDCKVDALLLRRRKADLKWAKRIAGSGGPLFLAGSTHAGEEAIALEAFQRVRRNVPAARLILAPRHPERSGEILKLAKGIASSALLSAAETNGLNGGSLWNILVVDRIGVLFELYGVVDGAFIGGSLTDKGGQNIMEPAVFGIPFSHGPFMRDFVDAARGLRKHGVATLVGGAEDMAVHWERSLNEEVKARTRRGADAYFAVVGGAARTSLDEIYREIAS